MKIVIKTVGQRIALLILTIVLATHNNLSISEMVLSKHIERIRMSKNVEFWTWHSYNVD